MFRRGRPRKAGRTLFGHERVRPGPSRGPSRAGSRPVETSAKGARLDRCARTFKASRAVRPTAWKVRFLAASCVSHRGETSPTPAPLRPRDGGRSRARSWFRADDRARRWGRAAARPLRAPRASPRTHVLPDRSSHYAYALGRDSAHTARAARVSRRRPRHHRRSRRRGRSRRSPRPP
jgi:hypothetical protein